MTASVKGLVEKAKALKAAGDLEEAIAVQEEAARLAPDNGVLWHNLGASLGDASRHEEAVAACKRAFATGLDAPETWLVMARSLMALNRVGEAEEAYRGVLKRRPLDTAAHRELAQLIWMLTGDVGRALYALDAAITQNPDILDLAITRAHVLGQAGDASAEYDEILLALARSGGAPQLELAAANAALAAGAYQAALSHIRVALAAFPEDGNVRQAYCRSLLAAGDAAEAEKVASRLHAQNPLEQHVIALLATAWRLLSDPRYYELYDYEAFVVPGELQAPKGWRSAEAYVDDLIEALDRRHQYKTHPFDQSVRHGSQLPSMNKLNDPVLRAYDEAVKGPILNYLSRLGAGEDLLRRRNTGKFRLFSAFSVRLASSGYHIDHVHPEGWLSSACHLRIPSTAGGEAKAGWLRFGEPGIPTTPKLHAEHFIEPKKGVLAVFPSYMWHGTVPFEGPETRLTIAIDILPV